MEPSSTAPEFTEAWLTGHDGTKFYTRTYPAVNPRAVLLFVHGFADEIGHDEWAHGVFASKGITVFAFDQRGFGRTALDEEHKSKESAYGKTSWREQFEDIEWWVRHLKNEHPDLPLFLMGHSMGGGSVLAFATRPSSPPARKTVLMLSGIIASAPLLLETTPTNKILFFIMGWLSVLVPNRSIDVHADLDVLSHDPATNAAHLSDPWIRKKGSFKVLYDMLSGGKQVLWNDYKHWPRSLPFVIVHGDADKVTSDKASQEFCEKVIADDKQFIPFKGGYHELSHEPDGMKEKFVDVCASWVLDRAERAAAGASRLQ